MEKNIIILIVIENKFKGIY